MLFIIDIYVCEVFDLCGNLIVEVEVYIEVGGVGWGIVLFGVLIGEYEVVEFCDGDKDCFGGKGVLKVVVNVNNVIVKEIVGMEVMD